MITSDAVPCVGDLGTIIYVRLLDESGTPQDASAATAITATVTRPNSEIEETIELVPSTDDDRLPEDGWAQYTAAVEEPSWFDVAGRWKIRPRMAIAGVGAWNATRAATLTVRI